MTVKLIRCVPLRLCILFKAYSKSVMGQCLECGPEWPFGHTHILSVLYDCHCDTELRAMRLD